MARMFKPVIPSPADNKKTAPKEQKGGQQNEGTEKAPKTGQKGRQG